MPFPLESRKGKLLTDGYAGVVMVQDLVKAVAAVYGIQVCALLRESDAVSVAICDKGENTVGIADGKAGRANVEYIGSEYISGQLTFLAGDYRRGMTVDCYVADIVAIGIRKNTNPVFAVVGKSDICF